MEHGRIKTQEELQESTCHLLYRLGVTANYTGYLYVSYAIVLCIEDQERLLFVTKRVYPEVAKRYGTNWKAVERSIRTAGGVIWKGNRPLLEELACRPLAKKPRAAQLLAILTDSVKRDELQQAEAFSSLSKLENENCPS